MPPIRTRPTDVIIRVPKLESYTEKHKASHPISTAATQDTSLDAAVVIPLLHQDHSSDADDAETETDTKTNSATIGFLSIDRDEKQITDLSKASTSSAEWNSLLIWARRQRGPQWDSATGIWQVDKGSQEYYSFCSNPSQSKTFEKDNQEQLNRIDTSATSLDDQAWKTLSATTGAPTTKFQREESPQPIPHGRSARLRR